MKVQLKDILFVCLAVIGLYMLNNAVRSVGLPTH